MGIAPPTANCIKEGTKHESAMGALDSLETSVRKLEDLLDKIRGSGEEGAKTPPAPMAPLSQFLDNVLLNRVQEFTARINETRASITSALF